MLFLACGKKDHIEDEKVKANKIASRYDKIKDLMFNEFSDKDSLEQVVLNLKNDSLKNNLLLGLAYQYNAKNDSLKFR